MTHNVTFILFLIREMTERVIFSVLETRETTEHSMLFPAYW